ncbi:hypothetical protein Bbelb_172870 [Branchiostoma belcheri]|nr:hypothetical protein Bbelb_172870 [Branchiostoma belcheri]
MCDLREERETLRNTNETARRKPCVRGVNAAPLSIPSRALYTQLRQISIDHRRGWVGLTHMQHMLAVFRTGANDKRKQSGKAKQTDQKRASGKYEGSGTILMVRLRRPDAPVLPSHLEGLDVPAWSESISDMQRLPGAGDPNMAADTCLTGPLAEALAYERKAAAPRIRLPRVHAHLSPAGVGMGRHKDVIQDMAPLSIANKREKCSDLGRLINLTAVSIYHKFPPPGEQNASRINDLYTRRMGRNLPGSENASLVVQPIHHITEAGQGRRPRRACDELEFCKHCG